MRPALALAACLLLAGTAGGQTISGIAQVTDGDSLKIDGKRIRLHGIDAPEREQECGHRDGSPWPCGREAAEMLRQLIGRGPVACVPRELDKYRRTVAVCSAAGVDLAEAMVRAGLALAYREYSSDYIDAENEAQSVRRGMWAGPFIKPWYWRRGFRLAPRSTPPANNPAACRIKGNISRNGKIYHVPGSRDYGRTKINESKGERWFCTEREAREAGWRAAGAPR